ncbi:MAG: hypothetical protein IT292_12010 [Deltaproteobacteria bacterium]|nr:hypothetical protein [Deltaproteobacteria bacterium]
MTETFSRQNISCLEMVPAYLPEKAVKYRPFSLSQTKSAATLTSELFRPSLFFERPEEISTVSLLPDCPPYLVNWQGQRYQIEQALGPERLGKEWWAEEYSSDLFDRDYFSLRLPSGAWIWVYRENNQGKWFIQGIWA